MSASHSVMKSLHAAGDPGTVLFKENDIFAAVFFSAKDAQILSVVVGALGDCTTAVRVQFATDGFIQY